MTHDAEQDSGDHEHDDGHGHSHEGGRFGAAVREVFDEVHARYRQPDGSYRQENVFRYVIARKPG